MTKKILVVDDEPAQLKLAEQVLKSNGYQVILANSGQESLRMIVD